MRYGALADSYSTACNWTQLRHRHSASKNDKSLSLGDTLH